ncbi:MAG: cysteine protease StiP domain-containing protein [Merdibacter sp.]
MTERAWSPRGRVLPRFPAGETARRCVQRWLFWPTQRAAALCTPPGGLINPSCCLNSTICGLISRSVHNRSIIGPGTFTARALP